MNEAMKAANKDFAMGMMEKLGYAPNPLCEHCNGFGRVHPIGYDGNPRYGETVMCKAQGCLKDSYASRSF